VQLLALLDEQPIAKVVKTAGKEWQAQQMAAQQKATVSKLVLELRWILEHQAVGLKMKV
jgi:hypothetical protein